MLAAWEDAHNGQDTPGGGSPGSDHEGRGDHTDGLIAKLIGACQMNDIKRAFAIYEKLRRMRVHLYEGVYKLMIECCMRTQQLGHAMKLYETLKGSGQRISARLAVLLMEACAREQHGDKVQHIWSDWCPADDPVQKCHSEVLLVAVSALIRTMSPELARDVLSDAMQRSGDSLAACLADADVELEELLELNETVADEASMNGAPMEEELARHFQELHSLLEELWQRCLKDAESTHWRSGRDELLMEDVDLDLDLAAM